MYAAGLGDNTLIAVSATLLALTTVSLALRLYVRTFLIRALGWDDALLILAYVSMLQFTTSPLLIIRQFVFVCYAAIIIKIALLPFYEIHKNLSKLITVSRRSLLSVVHSPSDINLARLRCDSCILHRPGYPQMVSCALLPSRHPEAMAAVDCPRGHDRLRPLYCGIHLRHGLCVREADVFGASSSQLLGHPHDTWPTELDSWSPQCCDRLDLDTYSHDCHSPSPA